MIKAILKFSVFFLFAYLSVAASAPDNISARNVYDSDIELIEPIPDSEETGKAKESELFGSHLWGNSFSLTELTAGGQVSSDYILGPEDALGIYLGDKAQQNFQIVVSTDGKVFVPTVGVFNVYGITIADFQLQLDKSLQKYYSHYSLDVMLIRPKPIRISVAGEVTAPGNYTLYAVNTVLDAIQIAKGSTKNGSLRNIELYRGDSLYTIIDIYDYLLRAREPEKIYLLNGDRIFVPVLKSIARIDGQVHRPYIYELSEYKKESISDLIFMAAGFTDDANLKSVEFSRQRADGTRVLEYLNFTDSDDNRFDEEKYILSNGDRVFVYSKKDLLPEQVVYILGEVKNPGKYEYEDNLTIENLILKAGGLNRSAYMLEAAIAQVTPQQSYKLQYVNLTQVLNSISSGNMLLTPDDQVFIRRIPQWQVGPLVEIKGEVKFPGFYPIVKDSTTLAAIIRNAGGLTEYANVREASLLRSQILDGEDKEFERLKEMGRANMSKREYEYFVMRQNSANIQNVVVNFTALVLNNDKKEDVVLQNGDVIIVPKSPEMVIVSGRVSNSGGVVFRKDADVKYYIKKAGGVTWDADYRHTKIIKVTGEILDDDDVNQLSPGDRIWVPRKPDRNFWATFRDMMLVIGQMATIYLVIHNTIKNN